MINTATNKSQLVDAINDAMQSWSTADRTSQKWLEYKVDIERQVWAKPGDVSPLVR